MSKLSEALAAVENLSEEIYDKFLEEYGEYCPLFDLRADGYSCSIFFMNFQIWFSEEDEREFDEEKNEYEPMENYIRREAQKIIDQISDIKLI